jgi:rSAM/selenodomain-associated transferase 2
MIWIIIPTYNEEKVLPGTLEALFAQPGSYEVIVVDGGSSDRTRELASATPGVRLVTAPKGRASQMNGGARHAVSCGMTPNDWLLFLHADTLLPEGALARLNSLEPDTAVQAGGFLQQFSGDDWRLRLVSALDNFRCRRSKIIYGDQALFVRQGLFTQLGGFPEQRILEDVAFCEKLVKVTTPVLLSPPVVTDSRKFVTMGVWRSFARVLLIILHAQFRLPLLPRAFFQDIR